MGQTKILLDSNSYFRLAKSIHPLLFVAFGAEKRCLYVLRELDNEFNKSSALQSKFSWVADEQFRDNRKKYLSVSGKQLREINLLVDTIRDYCLHVGRSLSRVDCAVVAHGKVLGIEIVSDDLELIETAEDMDVKAISTLALMKCMLDCGHIDIEKVREIVAFWKYIKDCPSRVNDEYEHHFGEKVPKSPF
jgi:hypothetical protein